MENNRKKGLIFTLYGNVNYGNKLQNYAVQTLLEKYSIDVNTVIFPCPLTIKQRVIRGIKYVIKVSIPKYRRKLRINNIRKNNFKQFDNNIKKIPSKLIRLENIDYCFIGSDQVYNSHDALSHQIINFFDTIKNKNIISISASIGNENILDTYREKYQNHFKKLNLISVREEQAKKIIETLTGRKDIYVLLDPTMLIDTNIWKRLAKKPKKIEDFCPDGKFVLNYFLGGYSEEWIRKIEEFAKENDCKIINILDENDPFYTCGPEEFLWLEENAFSVFTDSFHSCVFAFLFDTPFIVFDRINQKGNNMNSRIFNLLNKFTLEQKLYSGDINIKTITNDYKCAKKILVAERKKSEEFLKKALDIE